MALCSCPGACVGGVCVCVWVYDVSGDGLYGFLSTAVWLLGHPLPQDSVVSSFSVAALRVGQDIGILCSRCCQDVRVHVCVVRQMNCCRSGAAKLPRRPVVLDSIRILLVCCSRQCVGPWHCLHASVWDLAAVVHTGGWCPVSSGAPPCCACVKVV